MSLWLAVFSCTECQAPITEVRAFPSFVRHKLACQTGELDSRPPQVETPSCIQLHRHTGTLLSTSLEMTFEDGLMM